MSHTIYTHFVWESTAIFLYLNDNIITVDYGYEHFFYSLGFPYSEDLNFIQKHILNRLNHF